MSADLIERLNQFLDLPQGAVYMWADAVQLARDSAAEIVRLRGEVEALRQCGVKYLGWLGVKDAENGLRKDMADPEMVDRPAPAMPNGVEYDRELIAEMLDMYCAALTNGGLDGAGHYTPATIDEQAQLLRDADNHEARTVTRAADNRDAAGVCNCASGRGSEHCVVHASNDVLHRMDRMDTPAAVPAGEAVYGGNPCVECGEDTGTGHFPGCCLGTTPQPADGEAVAPLGYVRRKAISAMREDDEVTGIMVHVDAPSDSVPVYLHPPAPVQAAPQEGEDAAEAYRKAWEAGHAAACELVVDDAMVERAALAISRRSLSNAGHPWPIELCRKDARVALEAALQHRGDNRGGEG